MSGSSSSGNSWRAAPLPAQDGKNSQQTTSIGGGADPCVLEEITTLNSASLNGLRNVRVGDDLDVAFIEGPPRRLLVLDQEGEALGTITSRSMLQIIECIQAGRNYKARVLSVNGGACQVRVHLS